MAAPFLGEIKLFAGNFQIRGWAYCNGQLLSIADNDALYALLGTTYGGDGVNTFGLPNLQSRVALHQGQGPGQKEGGEQVGTGTVTLLVTEMASHSHTPYTRVEVGTADMHNVPQAGDYLSRFNTSANANGQMWNTPPLENATTLHPTFIGFTGGNQPVLAINYCICVAGVFPARN